MINPLKILPDEAIYNPPSDRVFKQFTQLVYQYTGNKMGADKKALLSARLNKRVRHLQIKSYDEYYRYLQKPENKSEIQQVIDALTTNETHFFREKKHFDFLINIAQQARIKPLRVWSAACSTGQEPYSIAMQLLHIGSRNWSITASDINQHVLNTAKMGRYNIELSREIPKELLRDYCLKGTNEEEGFFRIKRELRDRIEFKEVNLCNSLPSSGHFDIIFLRNVLIYFSRDDCNEIARKLTHKLVPGGYLIIGHSESLRDSKDYLENIAPTIYRRPERSKTS